MTPPLHLAPCHRPRLVGDSLRMGLVWVALVGCGVELMTAHDGMGLSHNLSADGAPLRAEPSEVRVDRLGPVEPPRVLSDEGIEVGVRWALPESEVARLEADVIVARAPGELIVVGHHEGEQVRFRLVVDPAVPFRFIDPPAALQVGEATTLRVAPDEGTLEPASLGWESSDPSILTVSSDGQARALAPGEVWVTAEGRGGSRATLQLEVRAASP